jgi:hypothetical protein
MAAGGCTLAFVRLIANWSMSRSETTPPNSIGRLSSLAAIREPTVAIELTDCYLAAAPCGGARRANAVKRLIVIRLETKRRAPESVTSKAITHPRLLRRGGPPPGGAQNSERKDQKCSTRLSNQTVPQTRMRSRKIATARHCRRDRCVYPAIRDGWRARRAAGRAPRPGN